MRNDEKTIDDLKRERTQIVRRLEDPACTRAQTRAQLADSVWWLSAVIRQETETKND